MFHLNACLSWPKEAETYFEPYSLVSSLQKRTHFSSPAVLTCRVKAHHKSGERRDITLCTAKGYCEERHQNRCRKEKQVQQSTNYMQPRVCHKAGHNPSFIVIQLPNQQRVKNKKSQAPFSIFLSLTGYEMRTANPVNVESCILSTSINLTFSTLETLRHADLRLPEFSSQLIVLNKK